MKTTLLEEMSVYQTFVDTCAFMNEGFQSTIFRYIEKMKEKGYILYTFPIVINELKHISQSPKQNEINKSKAKNALNIINILKKAGLLKIPVDLKGRVNISADHTFLCYFIKNSSQRKLQLITQDRNLTENIKDINRMNTLSSKGVRVSRFINDNLVF